MKAHSKLIFLDNHSNEYLLLCNYLVYHYITF